MMAIVRIRVRGGERPPAGSPIHVQARDTTFEDAPAPIVASAVGAVQDRPDDLLDEVELHLASLPDSCIVWVHVDVDDDGQKSPGDYLTTESFPIPRVDRAELEVTVRRI